ncbi:ABC transporter permease [Thioclava dalianensis]|uniref:ABC transporter permease n=1 Tax=Thioclava dalianensis TaxID=1185766 RepID=A0A074U0Y0_9RHOB|nr:iron ABC transporter permease [Thioclava dalianensis]KEP68307.1 ABC transporter permease [Thioclava dalianensis]SFN80864.1 iron complex transport system permease protein [Thioclava dalianensis]
MRSVASVFLALGAACLVVILSLALGARIIPPAEVWRALTDFDPTRPADLVVHGLRLGRTLTGLLTGAALAVAGLVMQQISRNPLADPGLLGVNGGAALAVVLCLWSGLVSTPVTLGIAAMIGAALAALVVFALGGGALSDRASILRLTLAGVAVSALCLSLVSAVVLLDQGTRDQFRFWTIGALGGYEPERLRWLWPPVVLGLGIALLLSRRLDALALGTETARAVGVRAAPVMGLSLLAVALLAGASVALIGPVGFIGLIVPHLVRRVAGPSVMAGVLLAIPLGGAVLLGCDTLGRVLIRPAEIQTGLILALAGGPCFLLLIGRLAR